MINDGMNDGFDSDAYGDAPSSSSYESLSDEDESVNSGEYGESDDVEVNGGETIETQIEGEFDRLVGEIRERGDLSSGAMLSRIWDASLPENEEDQFRDDLRAASGIGKSKGKGTRRARRIGPALSYQVRTLIGEGNGACVDGDLEKAIQIMLEVIRIEPRAIPAWITLSTCFKGMNKPHKALQLAIIGAHLRHDADVWYDLGRESKDLGLKRQALYCLGKAARLDPENLDALWDRASLAKDMKELKVARNSYTALLKRSPHNIAILTELRHILVEQEDLVVCASLYQEAFDHYTSLSPSGQIESSAVIDPALTVSEAQPVADNFTLMEILVLADLYNSMGAFEKTIKTIRSGCRWLQGRYKQKYWDSCSDDREYDLAGFSRAETEDELGDSTGLRPGHFPLDVNARHRLAVARLRIGDINEGRMHANIILGNDVVLFSELFSEIADAYFDVRIYDEARQIYETLGADESTTSMHVLMQAAACRRFLGDLRGASEVYERIIATDSTNNDAKMKLAEIYEINGQFRKALVLVYQVMDDRSRRPPTSEDKLHQEDEGSSAPSLFHERQTGKGKQPAAGRHHALSKQELEDLELRREAEAGAWYARLQELWDPMLRQEMEAENEWMMLAEMLVEMFRETRKLFAAVSKTNLPFRGMTRSTRKAKKSQEDEEVNMASRLELELQYESRARKDKSEGKIDPNYFRSIHFNDWLVLIMQYAFVLTQRDQFELADEVLRHVSYSVPFRSGEVQDTLRLAIITCALKQRRYDLILEQCRKLMLIRQFSNEPYRLFLVVCASGLPQTDQFIHGTLQKHVIRELRITDAAKKGTAIWYKRRRRYMIPTDKAVEATEDPNGDGAADEDVGDVPTNEKTSALPRPTRSNPVLYTIHGQSCATARSFQSSLFYLLQAYENCKVDPMICLSLSIASMGRAMQRQVDNRNYLVSQAFGFLSQYRSLRGAEESLPFGDEIEYNYGRTFHHIGLLSHAAKHYEKALEIIDKRQKESGNYEECGVAREAAYNLSLIYVSTGAVSLSKELYKRWLSI